jgi:hypothetical protein
MLHQPGGDEMLPEGKDVIEGPAAQDNAIDLAAAHTQAQAQRYGVRADIIRNLTDESLQVFGSIPVARLLGSGQPPADVDEAR